MPASPSQNQMLCVACLVAEPSVETAAVTQIEGTIFCKQHATGMAAMPRTRARMGMRPMMPPGRPVAP